MNFMKFFPLKNIVCALVLLQQLHSRLHYTGKMLCKYGPAFALYLYHIESDRVNTVQKRVRIYTAFFLC